MNLSAVQFRGGDIVENVSRTLSQTGLARERLELELTEGVLLEDTGRSLEMLNGLKALGVKLAMDDFGTGYSSLGYLQTFPFDRLKIDRDLHLQAHAERVRRVRSCRPFWGLGARLECRSRPRAWKRPSSSSCFRPTIARRFRASCSPGRFRRRACRRSWTPCPEERRRLLAA